MTDTTTPIPRLSQMPPFFVNGTHIATAGLLGSIVSAVLVSGDGFEVDCEAEDEAQTFYTRLKQSVIEDGVFVCNPIAGENQ